MTETIQQRLRHCGIGECSCDVKSPHLTYHAVDCHWRIVNEAADLIDMLMKQSVLATDLQESPKKNT